MDKIDRQELEKAHQHLSNMLLPDVLKDSENDAKGPDSKEKALVNIILWSTSVTVLGWVALETYRDGKGA